MSQGTHHCPRDYIFSKQYNGLKRSIQRSTTYQIFHNDCLCRTSLEDSSTLYDKPAAPLNYVPFTKYACTITFQVISQCVLWHQGMAAVLNTAHSMGLQKEKGQCLTIEGSPPALHLECACSQNQEAKKIQLSQKSKAISGR